MNVYLGAWTVFDGEGIVFASTATVEWAKDRFTSVLVLRATVVHGRVVVSAFLTKDQQAKLDADALRAALLCSVSDIFALGVAFMHPGMADGDVLDMFWAYVNKKQFSQKDMLD
ncbi:MAG: hypothetical protein LBB38_04390 [Puniceicoccales bacterium]|jgi:hypothetical protein|nr:hypothetical protein [Puniceicoccales bacterium]